MGGPSATQRWVDIDLSLESSHGPGNHGDSMIMNVKSGRTSPTSGLRRIQGIGSFIRGHSPKI